jgi:hypothetical protein
MITTAYNKRDTITRKGKVLQSVTQNNNKFMGSVVKFDQIIKYYTLKKTSRWTQRFTTHVMELLLHNSYVLYAKYSQGRKLNHYDFIEKIISYMFLKGQIPDPIFTLFGNNLKNHLPIKFATKSNCSLVQVMVKDMLHF